MQKAMPFVLEEIINDLKINNSYIQLQSLLNTLPLLSSRGLQIMRSKGQNNKQIYEL